MDLQRLLREKKGTEMSLMEYRQALQQAVNTVEEIKRQIILHEGSIQTLDKWIKELQEEQKPTPAPIGNPIG